MTGVVLSLSCLVLVGLCFPQAVGAQAQLGNPQPGSAQSGIGVISGWACEAQQIEIEFNNESANRWRAGTGTTRPDTQEVCGDAEEDFTQAGKQVWLSDTGRKKAIEVYERRKEARWKHPVTKYSLSYARLIELEARLLEKEWAGEPGLFARMRLR